MSLFKYTRAAFSRPVCAAFAVLCLVLSGPVQAQTTGSPLSTLIFETARPDSSLPAPAPSGTIVTTKITESTDSPVQLADASVHLYLTAINNSIEEDGPYSQTLSEQYEALGILYYQQGEFEDAITALEAAIHIQKVNKGLFSLDQSRLVEYLIRTHIARGDFIAVDNHKHYLYYLQEKNLAADDPRLITAKLDWADWNVEAFVKGYREYYSYPIAMSDSMDAARAIRNTIQIDVPVRRAPIDISGISSPGVPANDTVTEMMPVMINVPLLNSNSVITTAAIIDYNLRSVPLALSNEIILNQRLNSAEDIYESILSQMDNSSSETLQEQVNLHLKLANINYLLKKELDQFETIRDQGSIAYNRVNQEYTNDASMIAIRRYVNIKNDFEQLVDDIESSPSSTPTEKVEAYIALGDLHLSFDRPQRAFETYEKAFNILSANGYSQAEAESFLSPTPAIAVPEFGIHNYSREFFNIARDVDIPYRGHIDVSFNKDRFGTVSAVNIVASTDDTPQQVLSALVNYLRNQRFRPAFSASESIGLQDVQLRYFYYFR